MKDRNWNSKRVITVQNRSGHEVEQSCSDRRYVKCYRRVVFSPESPRSRDVACPFAGPSCRDANFTNPDLFLSTIGGLRSVLPERTFLRRFAVEE